MKTMKAIQIAAIFSLILIWSIAPAQEKQEINLADSTGLPGDNFSLQGALALFKESKSLEDFEKKLNSKDNDVNNLDLDGNDKTDYIRVIDNVKDQAHAIVLQVAVNKTESQDVAVIQIEKDGESSAMLQILGDEDLYGETTIVEPAENVEPADKGDSKRGPSAYSPGYPGIYFNVWYWPSIQFIYAPAYVVWVSPWYWDYYPMWWSPWRPMPWRYHYMSCYHYHHHYHYADYHRTTYANQVYAPRRNRSAQVTERYRDARAHYKATQATRPARPGTNMNAVRPGRPGTNDAVKPGRPSRPDVKPDSRPQKKPGTRPEVKPGTRPQTKPGTRPDVQPGTRPQTKPGTRPTVKPGTRPNNSQQVTPKQQTRPSQPARSPSRPAQPSKDKQSRPR
jgi:hypothetical protein